MLVERFDLTAFEKAYVQPSHSLLSAMVSLRTSRLLDVLQGVSRERSVLEIGCAFGGLLRVVLDAGYTDVSGCDVDTTSLKKALTYVPEATLTRCTAENLPYAKESRDVVICAGVLNYLEDPAKSLVEMRRVLRPSGILIVSVGNALSSARAIVGWGRLIRRQRRQLNGYRYYTSGRVLDMLRQAGFVPVKTTYFLHALPFDYRWPPDSRMVRVLARLRSALGRVLGTWWGNEFMITAHTGSSMGGSDSLLGCSRVQIRESAPPSLD